MMKIVNLRKMINPNELFSKELSKKVLLYSGGMDSFIISKLEDFDILLFIDSKSKYSSIERELIKSQNLSNLVIDDRLNLTDVEMDSAMVPLRNLFFVMIATLHGAGEIVLGATAGDRSTDKDLSFAHQSSMLMSYIYQKSWWHPGSDIFVNLKYKSETKQSLIKKYIAAGHPVEDLLNQSFSCYNPTIVGTPCFTCKPCIRKYTALLPFVKISEEIKVELKNYYTKEVIDELKENMHTIFSRGKEDQEVIDIVEKYL